ncbi:MAG: histidine ammonia-lyase [bacterium]
MASGLRLDGQSLTLQDCWHFLDQSWEVHLDPEALDRMAASRRVVEEAVTTDTVVYGVNTGFGKLSNVRIEHDDLAQLQVNLVLSHAAGVGAPLADDVARLILLLKANALASGFSGVRPIMVETCLAVLNTGAIPVIPSQGSVGASGDLAPLAHLALILVGHPEGRVRHRDRIWAAHEFLHEVGIHPLVLEAKEGLSILNGTQVSCALAAIACLRLFRLADTANTIAALSVDAFQGSAVPFDARISAVRHQPGQARVAATIAQLLEGSGILASHAGCERVQDPYSFRCTPQVHGACADALDFADRSISYELNAVTDNPLVFADTNAILSGGNFHAESCAFASDIMTIAATELASISERRTAQLLDPAASELPAFLVRDSGLNSGFMLAHVTSAALVSEMKTLSHPAVVDSIPTSNNKEDHVSMAPWAGRKCLMALDNLEQVLAIELLAAAQGIEFRRPLRSSDALEAVMAKVREVVAAYDQDRVMAPDIAVARELVREGL